MPPLPPRELSDLSDERYSSGCLKSTKKNWHGKGTKGYVSTISEGTVRPVRHSTRLPALPYTNSTGMARDSTDNVPGIFEGTVRLVRHIVLVLLP